jgi:hypothetical protein
MGFHQQLKSNMQGCLNKTKVLHNIWIAYQMLLEHCLKTQHKTLIYKVTAQLEQDMKSTQEQS